MSQEQRASEVFEPPSPPYSNVTVRRAFIVWMHCGQINKFRDVCNYFHVLEKLEEQLPPERRASSRHHEFNLFINPPPTSIYLNTHHPSLYKNTQLNDYFISKVEAIRNDRCVFKLDGFRKLCMKNGVTKKQILDTSRLIRNYCLGRNVTLDQFLVQFKQYAKRCNVRKNVTNVWGYIQKQLIKDEIIMISNWPVNFSFLDDDLETEVPITAVNNLTNQRRLLHSINVCPTMLKEVKNNPWHFDKRDLLNVNRFDKMNGKIDLVEKQYRKPG